MLVRRRRNPRDPLSILAAMLALLVVYGGLSGHWTYGRLISHLVLLLQVALADASAAFEERLARRPRGGALRPLVAPATAALLVGLAWSSAVKPTLDESVEGDPRWLSFLEAHVAHDDVVLADVDTCWYVPSFTGKVVAFPMKLPFVPDHAERLAAVTRFFERDVPFAERRRTIERYRVAWVLSARSHFDDGVARQEELRALGQVVYSSPDYELLQVTTPSSPKLLEQLRKDRGALDKATTYQVNGRSAGRSAPGAAPPILRRLRSG
jgi:alpha-1,6-mannosyltransferase